jgi:hypothetical protein
VESLRDSLIEAGNYSFISTFNMVNGQLVLLKVFIFIFGEKRNETLLSVSA